MLSSGGRRSLFLYGASLLLLALLDGLALYFVSKVFTTGTSGSSSIEISSGGRTLALVVVLFSLRTLLSTIASWYALRRLAREETLIGDRNFELLSSRSWTHRTNDSASELFNGVDRGPAALIQAYLVNVVSIAAESSSALIILLALLVLQPATAAIVSIYFAIVALLQHRLLSRRSARAGEVVVKETNAVYETLSDSHSLGKLLAIHQSGSLRIFLNSRRENLSLARAQVVFLSLLPRYFMELILAVGIAVIAGVTYAIGGSKSAIAAVTVFAAAGFRLLPIVNRIQALVLQLFSSLPVAQLAFVENPVRDELKSRGMSPKSSRFVLELENVSFSYPDSPHSALRDISISLERGLQYAIIGPSGAGKTTLVDVCLGLLTPTSGEVRVQEDIRQAYVPQDTHVANLSLSSNIALEWLPSVIDSDAVARAQQTAHLHGLLEGRDPGKPLSNTSLSGGQKQRIGLARALYRSPDVLFLDEVTSALDAETEHSVMKSIMNLKGRTTVVVVAHRLSTVRHADVVIYLNNGVVEGIGSFDDLRRTVPSLQRQIELGSLHLTD